ncbi:MAG: hypothetical protein HY077_16320 [Elusimicrobia bacterium]|nr:hypothetical protein [Elusimicrobiota bacterium]
MSPFLILQQGDALTDSLDAGGKRPLVLFKDAWWFQREDDTRRLTAALERRYALEPLQETRIDGRTYGFYRLSRR